MMCKRTEDFLFPPTGAIGQYRKGYENGYERGKAELAEILDKISAEIKEVQNMTSNGKGYEEGWKEALRYSLLQLEKYKKEGAE